MGSIPLSSERPFQGKSRKTFSRVNPRENRPSYTNTLIPTNTHSHFSKSKRDEISFEPYTLTRCTSSLPIVFARTIQISRVEGYITRDRQRERYIERERDTYSAKRGMLGRFLAHRRGWLCCHGYGLTKSPHPLSGRNSSRHHSATGLYVQDTREGSVNPPSCRFSSINKYIYILNIESTGDKRSADSVKTKVIYLAQIERSLSNILVCN